MNERDFRRPWPWWWGVGVVLAPAALAALILILCAGPGEARAGWFDFIGTTAAAVSEATWKVALIQALERTLPSLILLTCIVGAVGSGWSAAYLAMRLHDTARTALKDNRVSVAEWIVLCVLLVITLPVDLGLLWFAWFLSTAARSGLLELMR